MPHLESAKNFLLDGGWKPVPFTFFRSGDGSSNEALARIVRSSSFLTDSSGFGTPARIVADEFGPVPEIPYNAWEDPEQWD